MKTTFFVTGISTEVGKTVVSAALTEALGADYWKPVQAGDLDNSDSIKVRKLVQHPGSKFHDPAFQLKHAMSPHAAAALEKVSIKTTQIKRPLTENNLVIEGAGGLLVPLNSKETMLDLIMPEDRVILVSRHYLGSINHTLLSIEALRQRALKLEGIVFVGDSHESTESIIQQMGKVRVIGRINEEPYIDQHVTAEYAEIFRNNLK